MKKYSLLLVSVACLIGMGGIGSATVTYDGTKIIISDGEEIREEVIGS